MLYLLKENLVLSDMSDKGDSENWMFEEMLSLIEFSSMVVHINNGEWISKWVLTLSLIRMKFAHVRNLLKIGLEAEEIAVITPYNGQVELLRVMLLDDIPNFEIRIVDGFQGSEREAVVLSLVWSSAKGGKDGIGFLSDERRLNVAVTRAKRQCCIIYDSETVKQNSFLKSLVDWFEEKGEYISAMELSDDLHDNQMVATSNDISLLSAFLKNVLIVSQISAQETS